MTAAYTRKIGQRGNNSTMDNEPEYWAFLLFKLFSRRVVRIGFKPLGVAVENKGRIDLAEAFRKTKRLKQM